MNDIYNIDIKLKEYHNNLNNLNLTFINAKNQSQCTNIDKSNNQKDYNINVIEDKELEDKLEKKN